VDIEFSEKQKNILDDILQWYKEHPVQYLTFGGYAGTGKTTMLGYLGQYLHKQKKGIKIAYCSYTGKAARVLSWKLKAAKSIFTSDYIGTIHGLIYKAICDEKDNIIGWEKKQIDEFNYDLIVVDEASMVTKQIWEDLLSFGVPILASGDHGQLPPVEGSFNLMERPTLKLEEIFRQERENPIIKVSEIARRYGQIPTMKFSDTVQKLSKGDENTQEFLSDKMESFDDQTMVLTGYNRTRVNLNKGIRQLLEFESPDPQYGDRVICLKNNPSMGIFNGMTGTILSISRNNVGKFYDAEIALDGEDDVFVGPISLDQFGKPETLTQYLSENMNLFDFGYALTVHKAQGSQSKRVILFEERFPQMTDDNWRRWLYTAVTRAEEELYIIG
jgi:exodeoxyribonuclease-5